MFRRLGLATVFLLVTITPAWSQKTLTRGLLRMNPRTLFPLCPSTRSFWNRFTQARLTVIDAPAEATVIRVTEYWTSYSRVRSMLLPHCERLLHARIGKEFHANLALDRPSHHTLQVGPPGYLFRRDTNL